MQLPALLTLITMLNASSAHAAVEYTNLIQGCGQYLISGVIKKDPDEVLVLVVNQKTKSEYRLVPNSGELGSFAGVIETPITLVANVIRLKGHTGVVSNPSEIKMRVPNPLSRDQDTGVSLIKAAACSK